MKPPQVRVSKHVAQDPQINISFLRDSLMLHYLAKKLNKSTQGNAFFRIMTHNHVVLSPEISVMNI